MVSADARVLTGAEIVQQRDMYQTLFLTMIEYLNKGFGPEDAAERRPLKQYEAQFGYSGTFTYDAMRSMMLAYVPD